MGAVRGPLGPGAGTRTGLLLAAALAASCGPSPPPPHVRVVAISPSGAGVPVDAVVEVRFTGPVEPGALARIALVQAGELAAARAAVEADAGSSSLTAGVALEAALVDGGRRAVLTPAGPLRGRVTYAVVVAARLRDPEGRPVLDASGKTRASVTEFTTARTPGPPPVPVLTEVRADADSPEAGGEYAEVANLGDGVLDLLGWRLAKRTASGATSSCVLAPGPDELVPPFGVVLVAGGAWDDRYPLPASVPVLRCGASALLGGLSNEAPPALALIDPDGAVATTLGAGGPAPVCPEAIVRLDPWAPDLPWNVDCDSGSPGW
ncbi:MAG: Ig-like domain-containing protein [Anaeromyxobacteraceae bacterium]